MRDAWPEAHRVLNALRRYRHAITMLVRRDLRQRVAGTWLGVFWLVLDPLFLLLVYGFVFGVLLRVRFNAGDDGGVFALYLFAGLVPFIAFRETVTRSAGVLQGNSELIKKSTLPPFLLPLVVVVSSLVSELFGLLVLVVSVLLFEGTLSPWLPVLPLLVAVRLLLSLGVGWLVSVLTVFVRDLGQALGMLLTLLLFSTPILYPVSIVPASWRWLYDVNPFHHLVAAYRAVIIAAEPPDTGVIYVAVGAFVLAWLGGRFFRRAIDPAKDLL